MAPVWHLIDSIMTSINYMNLLNDSYPAIGLYIYQLPSPGVLVFPQTHTIHFSIPFLDMATPDYHLIGLYTRYSSKHHAIIHTSDLTSALQIGWTARVEAVLEYFQIPHTRQFIPLSEVSTSTLMKISIQSLTKHRTNPSPQQA
jgi:hypothetical protein